MRNPKRPQPLKVALSRQLRQQSTPAEQHAWSLLRGRKLLGLKFRRQHVIDGFIVDFYCPELRLVIEIDGSVHDEHPRTELDNLRTSLFARSGRRVVRIRNENVSRTALVSAISAALTSQELKALQKRSSIIPSPRSGEG